MQLILMFYLKNRRKKKAREIKDETIKLPKRTTNLQLWKELHFREISISKVEQ